MRTPLAVLILFQLFFATQLVGQKFRVGVTLGLDASTINGASGFHKVGFIGGAIVNTSITPKSIFQFELNFIQKGSLNPPDSLGNGYNKIGLSYIEMPLLIRRRLKFNAAKKPVTGFELEFGASVARLLNAVSINSQNATLPTDGLFNKYEVSLLAGLNYNISKNVYFCFRYSNSVIPAIKRNTPYFNFITYTWNRGNNQVLQFSFKFLLNGIGGKNASPEDVADPASN